MRMQLLVFQSNPVRLPNQAGDLLTVTLVDQLEGQLLIGRGLVIDYVLPYGPCDKVKSRLEAGDKLTSMNKKPLQF